MTAACPASSRDWSFGPIPAEWRVLPLKYLCSRSSLYGANVAAEVYENNGVRFLRTTDIRDDGTLNEGGVFVPPDIVADYMLSEGDFLISRSGTVGRAYVYRPEDGPCAYAGYLVRYALRDPDTPRWLFYITKSPGFQQWLGAVAIEATIGNVNGEKYANLLIPVPSVPQQRAIVGYLDRETARLDALVAAKERVLELLAEKRLALITRAVTRGLPAEAAAKAGLDTRAPLRDSGIAWLAEIPAHWEIERLKYCLHGIEQGWSPMCDSMPATVEEWGVLKAGCVNDWEFDPTENKRLPELVEPLPQYEVRAGDVLMSRANTTALLGSTALVRDVRPHLMMCDKLYRLDVDESRLCKEYVVALLRSPVGRYEIERDATGASNSMQNIGQDSVRNMWFAAPPLREQHAIVSFINEEAAKLNAMRSATERTIDLIKERRAALIAAAVTGQIDVGSAGHYTDDAASQKEPGRRQ